MKVILTGSTGFIGREVLHQCLVNPSVTSVVALSRRNLPEASSQNPKLSVVILDDFTTYTEKVLQELSGAAACIWCLGGIASKFPDVETARKVSIDYTIAAANAVVKSLIPHLDKGKTFRFVYCSGMLAERHLEKKLWFMHDTRRIKGEVENMLFALVKQHQDLLECFVVRPGGVLSKDTWVPSILPGSNMYIKVDELAAVMVHTALKGSDNPTMSNDFLVTQGRKLLKGSE